MLSFISAIQMNGRRIFSRMPGVVLESSSANARFPRHGRSADRGAELRVYLFFASIIILRDGARMETSNGPFDLRSIVGIRAVAQDISDYDIVTEAGWSGGVAKYTFFCLIQRSLALAAESPVMFLVPWEPDARPTA
ncbi:hypothetical protein [Bradyrhizobium sp. USDA 4473]